MSNSKLWNKENPRPRENTIELELQRLERISVALHIAIVEKKNKHIQNDLEELNKSITELRRLFNDLNS